MGTARYSVDFSSEVKRYNQHDLDTSHHGAVVVIPRPSVNPIQGGLRVYVDMASTPCPPNRKIHFFDHLAYLDSDHCHYTAVSFQETEWNLCICIQGRVNYGGYYEGQRSGVLYLSS